MPARLLSFEKRPSARPARCDGLLFPLVRRSKRTVRKTVIVTSYRKPKLLAIRQNLFAESTNYLVVQIL